MVVIPEQSGARSPWKHVIPHRPHPGAGTQVNGPFRLHPQPFHPKDPTWALGQAQSWFKGTEPSGKVHRVSLTSPVGCGAMAGPSNSSRHPGAWNFKNKWARDICINFPCCAVATRGGIHVWDTACMEKGKRFRQGCLLINLAPVWLGALSTATLVYIAWRDVHLENMN